MVKVEQDEEISDFIRTAVPHNAIDVKPIVQLHVKEEGVASSSSGHLRSHFVSMGFSPSIVNKVLAENGDNDSEMILEILLAHATSDKPETSSSLEGLFDSDNEENDSQKMLKGEDIPGVKEDIVGVKPEPGAYSEKRSFLLSMNFSEWEVDFALRELGETASLEQLADLVVTAQTAGLTEDGGVRTNEENAEALFGMMDKTLYLLRMGFTEEEVSLAVESFGTDVPISELADSIFARRQASQMENVRGVKTESNNIYSVRDFPNHYTPSSGVYSEPDFPNHYTPSSGADYFDDEEKVRTKRAKHIFLDGTSSSGGFSIRQARLDQWENGKYVKPEFPDTSNPGMHRNALGTLSNPPYFIYGNVVEISKDTWRRLSQFLYTIEPEYVNTQLFSALIRREGYIHNIPTENRHTILPRSPTTIEEAMPFTKQWWPSWDTRKQISLIHTETAGLEQLCEQLGKRVRDSRGLPSSEQQANILHQCKSFNLMWVGRDRLGAIEPRQIERILGYPHNHTQLFGLDPPDRLGALKFSFQVDTLAYMLSPLKDIYPDGLRVLSVYSGIGGAEIALHRLGIRLLCVVSVEASEVYRKILRRWWNSSEQTGVLRQLNTTSRLTTLKLEDLIREFGGFDLIVGANPGGSGVSSGPSTISNSMGMDSNLYFEYVRIIQRVRSMVGVE